jgi:hypothetical protein
MNIQQIVELVKASKGITSNVRDIYLTAIVEAVVKELTDERGLLLDSSNSYHLMFCVDYSVFRYEKPKEDMPRHLKYRLHSLTIHVGGGKT